MTEVNRKLIKFVSFISRDDKPLYIQSFAPEPQDDNTSEHANEFLKHNFLSHLALDIFTSPSALSNREDDINNNNGVTLLFIQDDIMVYGTEMNNGLKIIIGMGHSVSKKNDIESEKDDQSNSSKIPPKHVTKYSESADLARAFSQIHRYYLRVICNPFTNISQPEEYDSILQSSSFDKNVRNFVEEWNESVSHI